MGKKIEKITKSSTAEYFAKNLQQVGFSSPVKAVLTTLKEALDNALDACEEAEIQPQLNVVIQKIGKGALKGTDRISIQVEDNGPGIAVDDVAMVFGEYLASSKFGRGRCSRGQQGIGISAATTWAVQTSATGAQVLTKKKGQRKALSCLVISDLKKNKGLLKEKVMREWDKDHGTRVKFLIDGRLQLKGEGGILSYLRGTVLLNPHLSISYELADNEKVVINSVSSVIPQIPPPLLPHPHTLKLGEFITYARAVGTKRVGDWLRKDFSRVSETKAKEFVKLARLPLSTLKQTVRLLEGK